MQAGLEDRTRQADQQGGYYYKLKLTKSGACLFLIFLNTDNVVWSAAKSYWMRVSVLDALRCMLPTPSGFPTSRSHQPSPPSQSTSRITLNLEALLIKILTFKNSGKEHTWLARQGASVEATDSSIMTTAMLVTISWGLTVCSARRWELCRSHLIQSSPWTHEVAIIPSPPYICRQGSWRHDVLRGEAGLWTRHQDTGHLHSSACTSCLPEDPVGPCPSLCLGSEASHTRRTAHWVFWSLDFLLFKMGDSGLGNTFWTVNCI